MHALGELERSREHVNVGHFALYLWLTVCAFGIRILGVE